MADNTTVDNGALTDYAVSDEELVDGSKLQSVELHSESAGTKTKFGTASNPIRVNPTGVTTQPVSGAVTVSGTVTVDTELAAAVALSDNMANPTVPQVGAHLLGFDGTLWDRILATSGSLSVDVARVFGLTTGHFPIGDGTFAAEMLGSGADNVGNTVNELVTAALGYVFDGTAWDRLRGDSVGGAFMQGPVASDVAVAGNPLLAGARASTAVPTAVSTDGDAVALWALRTGALAVNLRDAAGAELAVGGGTQYDEDTASVAAEKVMMAGVVRKDSAASLVDADGDRTELQVDANGALRVTGGGGGTEVTEDAPAAANPTGGQLMARRADTPAATTDTDGDVIALNATNKGEAYVKHIDAITIQDGGNVITVDGTVGVSGTVTVDTEFPAAITPGDTDANPTAPETVARNSVWNGTQWVRARSILGDGVAAGGSQNVSPLMWNGTNYDRVRGDTTNGLDVDVTRVQGTVTVDTELAAAVALADNLGNPTTAPVGAFVMGWDGTNWDRIRAPGGIVEVVAPAALEVVGDVAHDVAAPANPVVIGGQMETIADSAPGTRAGTDGDAVKLASADGAIFAIPGAPQSWQFMTTGVVTGTQVHAAPGAGLSLYVTHITWSIGAATASSMKLLHNAGADVFGPHYLEAINGRGFQITFVTPLKINANTRLDVTTTGATTQTVNIEGFIAPG